MEVKTKICTTCEIKLEESETNFYFVNKIAKPGKFRSECRKCTNAHNRIYDKQYYQDNKAEILAECKIKNAIPEIAAKRRAGTKRWREENIEHVKEKERLYNLNNKDKLRAKWKRARERRKNDPYYVMRNIAGGLIKSALKRIGSSKRGKSITQYVDIDLMRSHIESLFEPWMTWLNNGVYDPSIWDDNDSSTWVWQLDHIVPQALLLYDSMEHINFKKCWDNKNLRPLSAKANNLKSDNIEYIPADLFTPEETLLLLQNKKINLTSQPIIP